MSDIHKALAVFQLEPGTSREAIQRRYKRLTKVWHPDRFQSAEDKHEAEEELKKINNANDIFKKHFESAHKTTGCECQKPAATGSTDQRTHGPGPGPGPHKKTADDMEAEAKRRDEERRRKAAAEEAARKAAEQKQQQDQQNTAPNTNFEYARKQQEELKWNKLRWQIAAGEAALFIGLCIFGNVGHGVKEWWHDFSWKWERDHAPQQEYKPNPAPINVPEVRPGDSPFGPVGPPPDNMLPGGVMKPLDNSQVPVPHYGPSTTTTNTGTDSGFNWKPTTPSLSTPSTTAPLSPSFSVPTTTGTDSGLNWKSLTPGTSTTTGSPLTSPLKKDWLFTPTTPVTSPYPQLSRPDARTKPSQADLDKYLKP